MSPDRFHMTSHLLIWCLLVLVWLELPSWSSAVFVDMNVSPRPARIYTKAPPNVPVAKVYAYSNTSGYLTNLKLENKESARDFTIGIDGTIRTKNFMNYDVGKVFKFIVYALRNEKINGHYQVAEFTLVEIIVSERNKFSPKFENATYSYPVYRYGVGDVIGQVAVTDDDKEDYNRKILIYAEENQVAMNYLKVDTKGVITLKRAVPLATDMLDLEIKAVDNGSPPKTGTALVTIDVIMVKQPNIFCTSATDTTISICWKNPMPEREFEGYTLKITGGVTRNKYFQIADEQKRHREYCYRFTGVLKDKQFFFDVKIRSDDFWYGGERRIVTLNNTGAGVSPSCQEHNFSPCQYIFPCQNGAICKTIIPSGTGISGSRNQGSSVEAPLQYICGCRPGWTGQNCTIRDSCIPSPCRAHGRCVTLGHGQFQCQCVDDYFGKRCQHFNECQKAPCQHGGKCNIFDNGTYSCDCQPQFSGQNCQVRDPCSPNPCAKDHGYCQRVSDELSHCVCKEGYFGDRCEHADQCILQQPCRNGGQCTTTNDSYVCQCPYGRTGQRCETNNPCVLAPCQNDGECIIDSTGGFLCECQQGFYGGECQYLDYCHGFHCNNGTCVADPSNQKAECVCDVGFIGSHCQTFDVCLTMNPPCNGVGRCVSNNNQGDLSSKLDQSTDYVCECFPQYDGQDCETFNPCHPKICTRGSMCVDMGDGLYECFCSATNQIDEDCSSAFDSCHDNRCENGADCVVAGNNTGYVCNCTDGWIGDLCEVRSPCAPELEVCKNGGGCVLGYDEEAYVEECQCTNDYIGRYCQFRNLCLNSPCLHGTCELHSKEVINKLPEQRMFYVDADFFSCSCSPGYTGFLCDVSLNPCDSITCQHGGDCVNGNCICPPLYTGETCEVKFRDCVDEIPLEDPNCQCVDETIECSEHCLSNQIELRGENNTKRCANLTRTAIPEGKFFLRCCGSDESRIEMCEVYQPDCSSRTHCSEDGKPDKTCQYFFSTCTAESDCTDFETLTLSCLDLKEPRDRGWIRCAQDKLNNLKISDPANLNASELATMALAVVGQIKAAVEDREIAELAMNIISNLTAVNVSISKQAEKENNVTSKMRYFLDEYTEMVNLSKGNVTLITEGFVVQAATVEQFHNGQVTFQPDMGNGEEGDGLTIAISLPKSVLEIAAANTSQNISNLRLQFVGYRKSQLFTPRNADNSMADISNETINKQRVISASIGNIPIANLSEPVEITLPVINKNKNHSCVFWDAENSTWSYEGVRISQKSKPGFVICESNHLTSFAVLVSPDPNAVKSDIGLSYITWIGSGISVGCLVITIVTYGLFKCLHGEKSGKILLNLCTSLLLLNIVFLAGSIDVSDFSKDVCTAIAIMLHYFLMSTLWWMLVEAVEMYRAIVVVFMKYERLYLLKRLFIGWGIPAIIVAATASVDLDFYGSNKVSVDGAADAKICFIKASADNIAYYAAVLGPACLIVIINTIVFVLVVRVILKPRFQQQITNNTAPFTPAQVRGAFTVMFLLGVTWIFGPLAIGDAAIVFSYLFCISNSVQGLLIFIFRCLFNPEAKLAWIQLYRTGTLKRKRGPIKSKYLDSSSSKDGHDTSSTTRRLSNSATTNVNLTVSTNTSESNKLPMYRGNGSIHAHPHQLHTTNGWHPNLNGIRRENGSSNGGSLNGGGGDNIFSNMMTMQSIDSSKTSTIHSNKEEKETDFKPFDTSSTVTKSDTGPDDSFSKTFDDEFTHL